MGRKPGKKSIRGEAESHWGETKVRVNFALTPTGKMLLDKKAQEYGLSRSELVERFARGLIPAQSPTIAELAVLVVLSDNVDLKPERLKAIMQGDFPTNEELVDMYAAIGEPWNTDLLMEIRSRDFATKPEKLPNGH